MMTWKSRKSTSEALDLHGSWNGRPRSMHQALRPTGDTSDAALCTVTPSSKPVVTRARARAPRCVICPRERGLWEFGPLC